MKELLRKVALAFLVLAGVSSVGAADRDRLEAELRKAAEAFRGGDAEQALEHVKQAVIADPSEPRAHFTAGQIHQAMRDSAKAITAYSKVIELEPRAVDAFRNRGIEHFRLGHVKESVEDFNRELKLEPARLAHHWMRGLSFYYAGEFVSGKSQFEVHKSVNPHDVENAVWHFLCTAKAENIEKARDLYIPIEGDSRVPMMEVHALFGGKGTVEDVMKAVERGEPRQAELKNRYFFAHLYLGLYYDALGDKKKMKEHIDLATGKYAQQHYMGDCARVHKMMIEGKLSHQGKRAPVVRKPAKKK
jgi:lipoprotein NlpI